MGQLTKALFFLGVCGILVSTAACHKMDDGKLSPAQMKTLREGKQNVSADANEDKSDINSKNIAAIIKVLSQADNIFEQVWPYVWEEGVPKVNNVFRVSKQYIKIKFTEDGRSLGLNSGCTGVDVSFRITKKALHPTQGSIPVGYALFVQPCQAQKKIHLMTWEVDFSGNMNMAFETSNYPQGTGLSLKTLGKNATCQLKVDPSNNRLNKMNCVGLGQNKTTSQYMEFTKFEFDRDNKLMVHIVGNRYKSLQDLDRKIDMLVPLAGDIVITEKVIEEPKPFVPSPVPVKSQNEVDPNAAPKAPAQKQAATPAKDAKTAAADKKKAQDPSIPVPNPETGEFDQPELTPEQVELLKQGIPLEEVQQMSGEQQVDENGQPIAQQEEEPTNPALLN